MMNIAEIEREIKAVQERNRRVEADKAWETSWTRRLFIGLVTYLTAGVWLMLIHDEYPWPKAFIPSVGYLLSTLSLPLVKQRWIRGKLFASVPEKSINQKHPTVSSPSHQPKRALPESPKHKVLHFEDDEVLAELYQQVIRQEGLAAVNYPHPSKDPVSIVVKEKPDLILMDIIMPKMDGYEATKILKSNLATKNIPIVGLDNLSQSEDIQKALNVGMADYLIKANYTPREVVRKIKTLLNVA